MVPFRSSAGIVRAELDRGLWPSARGAFRPVAWLAGCLIALAVAWVATGSVKAQPGLTDPNLRVTVVASGFSGPIGVVFLPTNPASANDMLVLEKASGQIKRVINGV